MRIPSGVRPSSLATFIIRVLVPSATFIIMMHHTFTVKNDVYYYDALDPGTTCNFYYYDDAFSCKGSRPLGATFSKRQLGRGGARLPLGLEPPIPGAAHQASCGRRTARSWRGATHAPERAELADEGRSSAADEALLRSDPAWKSAPTALSALCPRFANQGR